MNIAFYILTYNRPTVLKHCLLTLFGNTEIHPNEAWILDDGSEPALQRQLLDSCIMNHINFMACTRNYGIGYAFERLYNLIWANDDLDIACIIESDYIWRKGWLEDVCSVFEASPYTLAVAGTDHPHMYEKDKTHVTFPEIMTEIFGRDLYSRDSLYKPFDLITQRGPIKVQGVSNSCGCMILNWKRLKTTIKDLEDNNIISMRDYKRLMDRAFNKWISHDTRKHVSDGHMSCVISMYGEMFLKLFNIDTTRNFPMLSICDYSISEHLAGGGENGGIIPEGAALLASPTWKFEYLKENPRL